MFSQLKSPRTCLTSVRVSVKTELWEHKHVPFRAECFDWQQEFMVWTQSCGNTDTPPLRPSVLTDSKGLWCEHRAVGTQPRPLWGRVFWLTAKVYGGNTDTPPLRPRVLTDSKSIWWEHGHAPFKAVCFEWTQSCGNTDSLRPCVLRHLQEPRPQTGRWGGGGTI